MVLVIGRFVRLAGSSRQKVQLRGERRKQQREHENSGFRQKAAEGESPNKSPRRWDRREQTANLLTKEVKRRI